MTLGLPIQWRIGGGLLIAGGLLGLIGALLLESSPSALESLLTIAGLFGEGAGLATVSFGFGSRSLPRWVRRLTFAAGILLLLEFLASIVALFAADAASFIEVWLYVLAAVVLLISAVAIARTSAPPIAIRLALLPAAIYEVIDFFLLASGYGGRWWTLGILGGLYALAGVVFVLAGRRPAANLIR